MDSVNSFKNYTKPLEELNPSEILGNGLARKSEIPRPSDNFKLPENLANISATSRARDLSKSRTPRPKSKSRARLVSETDISPTHQVTKVSKMAVSEQRFAEMLKDALGQQSKEFNSTIENQSKDLKQNLTDLEKTLGSKISEMSDDIVDIKKKQKTETDERADLTRQVDILTEKVQTLTARLDSTENPANIDEIADKLSNRFSKEIQTTHFKNLVNEIRQTETGLMIFGYKPEGGPNLVSEMKQKFLVEKLQVGFDVGIFQAEKIGRGNPGKNEAPIKLTFSSFYIRNQVLMLGQKLPKGLKMEKCLPREYRSKNKEFLHLGWQLKLALRYSIKTRVVMAGHLICLQVKKNDVGDTKYDWVIQKEWFPPQRVTGDRSEVQKTRVGLTPTPEIKERDTFYVMFTDLTPAPDGKQHLVDDFLKNYLEGNHSQHIEDTVDHSGKNMIMIKVGSKDICEQWEAHYSLKKFNGSAPKIQLIK